MNTKSLKEMLNNCDLPLDHKTALHIRKNVVKCIIRDQDKFGYNSARNAHMSTIASAIPNVSIEAYSCLNSGDLSRRLYAGRVFAKMSNFEQKFTERLMAYPKLNDYMAQKWADALETELKFANGNSVFSWKHREEIAELLEKISCLPMSSEF